MLKPYSLFVLLALFIASTAYSQENEQNKTVSPKEINNKELIKIKSKEKHSSIPQSEIKSSQTDTAKKSEYPKKLSVGVKRSAKKDSKASTLTKDQEIEKLENAILSVESKINYLKESGEADQKEIKKREDSLNELKKELKALKLGVNN